MRVGSSAEFVSVGCGGEGSMKQLLPNKFLPCRAVTVPIRETQIEVQTLPSVHAAGQSAQRGEITLGCNLTRRQLLQADLYPP